MTPPEKIARSPKKAPDASTPKAPPTLTTTESTIMNRWKIKTGMTEGKKGDRDLTLVVSYYDKDDQQIKRAIGSFSETMSPAEFADALRKFADEVAS
jgi:hypothetical protein